MLYRDAPHVDVRGFYARNPAWGKLYRLLGLLGVVAGAVWCDAPRQLAVLLAVLVALWLVAWYQVVGALWRSALVAACLLAAIRLLLLRGGAP